MFVNIVGEFKNHFRLPDWRHGRCKEVKSRLIVYPYQQNSTPFDKGGKLGDWTCPERDGLSDSGPDGAGSLAVRLSSSATRFPAVALLAQTILNASQILVLRHILPHPQPSSSGPL